MNYSDLPLWEWSGSEITFKPEYNVSTPKIGKEPVSWFGPIWMYKMSMPPVDADMREDIEAEIYEGNGVKAVRMYDHRKPYPKYYRDLKNKNLPLSMIPDLTVIATTKAARSITVQGTQNDFISKGDPIAFTHGGRRHYYCANSDLRLTGGNDILPVRMPPRVTLTGLSILAERIKPTLAFTVDYNKLQGPTRLGGFTDFSVEGFEYLGNVT